MALTAEDLSRAGWRRVVRMVTLPAGPEADESYWLVNTKSIDDLPAELIGTSLDPVFSGEVPTKAEIDAEMKAIKATKAARPIRIASFEC